MKVGSSETTLLTFDKPTDIYWAPVMCPVLPGTVFLKHKPSQSDCIVVFCYPLSTLLTVKKCLCWTKAWKVSTSASEFSGGLLF